MTTSELSQDQTPLTFTATSGIDLLFFWYQPWINAQRMWLETLNNTHSDDMNIVVIMAPFYSKLLRHMLGFEGLPTPVLMVSCYREIASDMAEATLQHLCKVAELSER
ncbi:MAG: hypothetical protein XD36_3089 [Halomonas sp. 54_146]|nr:MULTISPECIES: hypothetical protein [unclassified Halomonas]KUJ86475.1 MAG: hypothetical protein XD36_3089 [Halomonas sp. 54_146]HAA45297.1 hypothetical protein [Halomonas sp.]